MGPGASILGASNMGGAAQVLDSCALRRGQGQGSRGVSRNMTDVIVSHAADDAQRAALVAEKLSAMGYDVRRQPGDNEARAPFTRRRLRAEIAAAHCVVVLWSRAAQTAPALKQAAIQARAAGKLTLARLDAAA